MMRKLRKLSRYSVARLRPRSAIPFLWHIGQPNFGDDLNPALFGLIAGRGVRLERHRDRPHFLGMGSILARATPSSIVLGAGFLAPPARHDLPGQIVSVRGALSRNAFAQRNEILLGDPMVLLNLLVPFKRQTDGPLGFVPHVSEFERTRRLRMNGLKVIDPALPPWRVIQEIAGCSRIMSQSLHGLIVADALEIPNLWIAPGPDMVGRNFKFEDYFSTLDGPKSAHPFDRDLQQIPPEADFDVGIYRYDKRTYLETLRNTIAGFRT